MADMVGMKHRSTVAAVYNGIISQRNPYVQEPEIRFAHLQFHSDLETCRSGATDR
jgi:hypothetical protein